MSKDNQSANLRLLGSPVNLTNRSKKKDDRKNIRNRPRSALPSTCFTPDYHERNRRPYSADGKARSSNNLLKTFNIEVLPCNPASKSVKIFPPTTEILGKSKCFERQSNREICSNASDYGSEDTFISLGTKIKAKAQLHNKNKPSSNTNYLKYRNIAKQDRLVDNHSIHNKMEGKNYDMEVKISEKVQDDTEVNKKTDFSTYKMASYESYFLALDSENYNPGNLKLSHNPTHINDEIEQAINTYGHRLTLSKQQLSLVEEESTQDLSSLSPENSLTNAPNCTVNEEDAQYNILTSHKDDMKKITQNYLAEKAAFEQKTYKSFYDDFQSTKVEPFKSHTHNKHHIDSCSKDSGYTDSGSNEEKTFKRVDSLPNSVNMLTVNNKANDNEPKSFDSSSCGSANNSYMSTYPPDKRKYSEWTEPLNHSRLLYKDFFLRKEINGPKVPENSPIKADTNNCMFNEDSSSNNAETSPRLEYPTYLLNSSTKAYTSKVIEDYKKEIEAINNLHKLTIKDIKTDSISPTPLHIDKMFEQLTSESRSTHQELTPVEQRQISPDTYRKEHSPLPSPNNNDVSTLSTKELIQNYYRVKDSDFKKDQVRPLKKYDRKSTEDVSKFLNNSPKVRVGKSSLPIHVKNSTLKNVFTVRTPLSARIDKVQHDKDVDSWMSLDAAPPKITEVESFNTPEPANIHQSINDDNHIVEASMTESQLNNETKVETKELDSNATVLDIYSMLKEIESYGDNPVNAEQEPKPELNTAKDDERSTPKDNFMEIFEFLEKVEQSANDALSVVTNTSPPTMPKLEVLLKLPQTELAQRLITASLQLEERSCCIALLQESLTSHKQQMVSKVSSLEKQSTRNVTKVKQECEEAIKRHQNFIDQLINDKKTLNHRIEQLVDERRTLEERWKRSAQTLEDRYKLELKNQHDKMAAAQQVARQRWVRQKAEKIKELTVKGLEGELRDMADRQQKEISDLKMYHAEHMGRVQSKHAMEMEEQRRTLEAEKEAALLKERQMASARLEKQILELEMTYQEQRTRLVGEMRAENDKMASGLTEREKLIRAEIEKWKEEQEEIIEEKRSQMESDIAKERAILEDEISQKRKNLEGELSRYKQQYENEQQILFKKREKEIAAQYKQERDKEIEKAIESMETEAQNGRKELQEALRRNKEQYETELKELAETEQATLKRYQDTQARVRQTEDECAQLHITISQLEAKNRILSEKNSQLEKDCEEIRSNCEQSWRQKVEELGKQIEDTKKTHDEQMHQLYAKVKVAVARKDSAIQALTREAAKYQEKITLLEQKLQQQRKDFLKQK